VFRFLLIIISLQFPALLSQEFFSLIFSRPLTLYKILLSDAKQVQEIDGTSEHKESDLDFKTFGSDRMNGFG
jgi:hypothetical protein